LSAKWTPSSSGASSGAHGAQFDRLTRRGDEHKDKDPDALGALNLVSKGIGPNNAPIQSLEQRVRYQMKTW
jgi:hypothetical protein